MVVFDLLWDEKKTIILQKNCTEPDNPDVLSAYAANPVFWHDGLNECGVSHAWTVHVWQLIYTDYDLCNKIASEEL